MGRRSLNRQIKEFNKQQSDNYKMQIAKLKDKNPETTKTKTYISWL